MVALVVYQINPTQNYKEMKKTSDLTKISMNRN